MNIKNAKQIVFNPTGKIICENSNFIDGECIVSEKPILSYNADGTPDKIDYSHKNTRLSHWKGGVFTPILQGYKGWTGRCLHN